MSQKNVKSKLVELRFIDVWNINFDIVKYIY